MAIIYETIERDLVKAYSDEGFLIRGGSPEGLYTEAIDPIEAGRVYTETDIKIPESEGDSDAATIEDYQAALKELGVE